MNSILANSWDERRPNSYDVVVVGSGYGGAITAARLANAPFNPRLSVCIVERGQEWPIGNFPDSLGDLVANSYHQELNPLGLYEFDAFRDIAVIKGSGLGGTSLVNANVAIRPEPDMFVTWPSALNRVAQIGEGLPDSLWNYYKKAEDMLAVSAHPMASSLKKFQALQKRAAQLGQSVETLPLAVNFLKDEEIYKGIHRHKCIDCGDCVSGCNVGAKNTLYMNYLPLAKSGGAQILTQTEVNHVESHPDGWALHVTHREDPSSSEEATILAKVVVLAGGALGSPKMLLRSQQNGLSSAPALGQHFSGNGDFFALAYNSNQITDIVGWGNHKDDDPIAKVVRAGPSIVGLVRYNEKAPPAQRFVIEDLSIPRAYRDAAAAAFGLLQGEVVGNQDPGAAQERQDRDFGGADSKGALNSTMLYLCMAQDNSGGTMSLDAFGNLQILWPSAGGEAIFQQINNECRAHAAALGSLFIENPIWKVSPWQTLITAHPLGGCSMGEDGNDGAVDHLGRVFRGAGTEVHPGLYVADGSIVRGALGVNPFLTISALSERIADHIISEHGTGGGS